MTTPTVAEILKYADLQMSAEAFLLGADDKPYVTPEDLVKALVRGNDHNSRFTESQAANFAAHWKVLDQRANTPTGFSGTLFQCILDDDKTGAKAGELVMSFRSTEFIDDAARDNQATNAMEIKNSGWAFGQIRDMEDWFNALKADPKFLGAGQVFSVTGYSLGGHLATAFNIMHPGATQQVVTFNGAGVGEIVQTGDGPKTLNSIIIEFNRLAQNANGEAIIHTSISATYASADQDNATPVQSVRRKPMAAIKAVAGCAYSTRARGRFGNGRFGKTAAEHKGATV